MPEAKAFELLLTPQLGEMISCFVPAILGSGSRELLERLTNKEKYALRQAFLRVTAIEELNMDPRYKMRADGQLYSRQHMGLLSGFPDQGIPQPIEEQLRTKAGQLSDIISNFFIGRTDDSGLTQKGDPRQLTVTLYGASAETIHAILNTVLKSLKKKEGQEKIAKRNTVVFWGMPNVTSTEYNQLVGSEPQGSSDYGPNIILVLPTPCRETGRAYAVSGIYADSQEIINSYKNLVRDLSHAFNYENDYPKIAVIYYDVDGITEEMDGPKERNDSDTGITVQAVLSTPLISPTAWAEFPEFKELPAKLIQDINILSKGDILLLKCLLHACHEHMEKGLRAEQMRLTPKIVVIALQNYLQIFGIDAGTAKDVTFLQRLLLLARVVSYPDGIVRDQWWYSAFSGENKREDGDDLVSTLLRRRENISLHTLIRRSLMLAPGGGVPYGEFVLDGDRKLITITPVVDRAPSIVTSAYRLDQSLLRVLNWLLDKGHVARLSILSENQVKKESGEPIRSVVCAYCGSNIDGATVQENEIRADNRECSKCNSKVFRVRYEYVKYKPAGSA